MPTTSPIDIGIDELLTTTRAVRKRLDLERDVSDELVRDCLEIALQAPTSSNMQDWHFIVLRDPEVRGEIAALYRQAYERYRASPTYDERLRDPDKGDTHQRVASSSQHLATHMHEVPVLLIPCVKRRAKPDGRQLGVASLYGSIIPATWSFMLAARSRGLGTAWTTLHLRHEQEAAEILGIPYEDVTQVALIPVAHYTGDTFGTAPRTPLVEVTSLDRYGQAPPW